MAEAHGETLFLAAICAMAFVFAQVPITDVIISRYVADRLRPRVLSAKFVVNLSIGALTLPLTSWILGRGEGFGALFQLLAIAALLVVVASMVLPGRIRPSAFAASNDPSPRAAY